MTKLPPVSGDRLLRALLRAGFVVRRQSGSHVVVSHPSDVQRRAVIPLHGSKTVKPGTLHAILKGAGISVDELKALI